MAISTIRRATDDDFSAVRAAAVRFCDRHGLGFDDEAGAEAAIEYEIESGGHQGGPRPRIRKLWTAVYCRSLGVPTDVRTTIAYGHIGLRCE